MAVLTVPSPTSTKQEDALLTIGRWLRDKGVPPTVRDLMADAGISSTSVAIYQLRRLAAQGYVTLPDGPEARGIRLTELGNAWLAERGVVTPGWALLQLRGAALAVVDDPTRERVEALAAVLATAA